LPSFAGLWLDQRRGGVITVAFAAGHAAANRAAIESAAPAGSTVEVIDVKYSWAELEQTLELVERDRLALKEEGLWIRELGIDPRPNRVEVAIGELTDDAVKQLHTRFGDAIVVEQSGNPTFTACTDRYNCIGPPVRAGIATSPGCSLAFQVKVTGAPGTGWLTASHPPLRQPGKGHLPRRRGDRNDRASCWDPCLRADASLGGWLNSTYDSDWVYVQPTIAARVEVMQSSTGDYIGQTTCLNGARQTGSLPFRCGVLDEIRRVDYGDHYFLDQRYATFHAYVGDSGGAVHSPRYGTYGYVAAYGVQSGCENLDGSSDGCQPGDADGRSIYSHVAWATSNLSQIYGASITVCPVSVPCP